MINLELYRIFKVVAEEENITKASQMLLISQPAVTKHIKHLEESLNIKLFTRSKYGMELNDNGKKLYKKIAGPLSNLLNAESIFEVRSKINLGVHVNFPDSILKSVIREFYKSDEDCIINSTKLIGENIFDRLSKQKIDLAISKKYDSKIINNKDIKFIKVGEFANCFVARRSSKYLHKIYDEKALRDITIYTLKKFSPEYKNLVKILGYDKEEEANIENVTFTSTLDLMSARDIMMFTTREYVEPKIENGDIKEVKTSLDIPNVDWGIYYNVNNNFSEIKELVRILRKIVK